MENWGKTKNKLHFECIFIYLKILVYKQKSMKFLKRNPDFGPVYSIWRAMRESFLCLQDQRKYDAYELHLWLEHQKRLNANNPAASGTENRVHKAKKNRGSTSSRANNQ